MRGDLQRDLHGAEVALDQAARDREAAHAAPARNIGRCHTTDFILKRAIKLRENLRSALQLFPCGATEVATFWAQ